MNRLSGSHVFLDCYCTHTFERAFCLEEGGSRPLTTDATSLQKGEADTHFTADRAHVSPRPCVCVSKTLHERFSENFFIYSSKYKRKKYFRL